MKHPTKYLARDEVVKRGVTALLKELGPIETRRFIELSQVKREDSVKRHRQWQAGLDKEAFLKEVFSSL
jgi:hypothetical protein